MSFSQDYLSETLKVVEKLDPGVIEKIVKYLVDLRNRKGRLFILGVGGGAGHAAHAVGDFRKIAGIEAYAPSDNMAELTARVNDEGWETAYSEWLKGSRINQKDMLFIFSVGGGDMERNISANLVRALETARKAGAGIVGVVGRDGGYTAEVADCCVIVPTVNPDHVTAHTESFQALIWHLMVSHPDILVSGMKWETSATFP